MRRWPAGLFLCGALAPCTTPARADDRDDSHGAIRVALECEQPGRTKACPAFLLGFVDAHPVLLASPRAEADVVIYAAATEVALTDRLHLRFVAQPGHLAGAPAAIELDALVDTRATDDDQRAVIEPVFLRGLALFVAARHPGAVAVTLATPEAAAATVAKATTPWGLMVGLNGFGNYTDKYRSANANLSVVGKYVTRRLRALTGHFLSGGINRLPPLTLADGSTVSLDSSSWAYRGGAELIHSFDDHWSLGVGSYTSVEDRKAQYRYSNRSRVALEWDRYRADDPRGNRLAVFYHLGWAVERYNLRNELGETFAQYPVHGVNATGSVRHDRISYGLTLESDVQLNHPSRRYQITASPFVTIQVGDHVDLNLSFSITKRQLPAPDPTAIDPADYEQLSRLSYAEPLSMFGGVGLSIHWDPTNGARNDRLDSI
jgi:hypothetical protein